MVCAIALAQTPATKPAGLRRVFAPRDAAAVAFVHCGTIEHQLRPYRFYVWDNLATDSSAAAINFTMNAVLSQASRIVHPEKLAGGRVLAYDLLELLPVRRDFLQIWNVLQELADVEPYFHQPKAKPGGYGKTEAALGSGGAGPLRLLEGLTTSRLPIVRGDWLIATAWSSVDLYGIKGSYYQLAQIADNLDGFLKDHGADVELVKKLRNDQRTVMISAVTGSFRQIEMFSGSVRPEFGPSYITVTLDMNNKDRRVDQHAFLNLEDFKVAAKEAIAAKRNGLHAFILTDGNGKRQDAAPSNVAGWKASPFSAGSPFKQEDLIAGISCIECHGGQRGYNPTENFVHEQKKKGFGPLADKALKRKLSESLDRLRGLYDGEFELPLKDAGNAYAKAVDNATWGVFGAKSVEGVSAQVFTTYASYFGTPSRGGQRVITARHVLNDLGYDVPEREATAALAYVIPELEATIEEDGRIGNLRTGVPILRDDVHEIFFELAIRDVLNAKE